MNENSSSAVKEGRLKLAMWAARRHADFEMKQLTACLMTRRGEANLTTASQVSSVSREEGREDVDLFRRLW